MVEKKQKINSKNEKKNTKNSDIWIVHDCENKNNRVDFQVPVIDLIWFDMLSTTVMGSNVCS